MRKQTTDIFLPAARLSLLLFSLAALGVGCVQISGLGGVSGPGLDGGVWKSADKGANWIQKALIPTTMAQKRSIAGTNVNVIVQDPQDHNALYIGTAENGMFYTLDGGENWFQVNALKSGRVSAIAIDPRNKCVIYAAYENKILRSSDCSRTWQTIYFETRTEKYITALSVGPKESRIIFAGNSAGDLNMSADSGASWLTANRFASEVKKILIAPYDNRKIYAGTKSSGIWKSVDGGANWIDISQDFNLFSQSFEYRDLVLDIANLDALLYASQFGVLRSSDGGLRWNKVELLTPPGAARIYSLGVNPKNGNEIYYATATTFYSSMDGGSKWKTRKLPTSRAAAAMLVDPSAPNVIYLGVTRLKQ